MLIVDAGPLFAAAARNDRHHSAAVDLFAAARPPLIVPCSVTGTSLLARGNFPKTQESRDPSALRGRKSVMAGKIREAARCGRLRPGSCLTPPDRGC